MLSVLVANQNKSEGKMWRERLRKSGLSVLPECGSLSEMVDLLSREKAHIVLCAAGLVTDQSLPVLRAAAAFFPRVKPIVVGDVQKALLLSRIPKVMLARNIDSAVRECMAVPPPDSAPALDPKEMGEQGIRFLLGDHFMSNEEAAVFLSQLSQWEPGYAVLYVAADSCRGAVLHSLKKAAADRKIACVLPYDRDAFCLILDKSPAKEYAVSLANDLRLRLLRETGAIFSIGISRPRIKAGELQICRREAARACKATQIFGHSSVIHIDYLDASDIEYAYPKHKERRLIEATMDGDTETAVAMLDEIFEIFKARRDLKQGLINKMILGVIVGLNIAATSRAKNFEKMNLDSLALSKLMAVKSADEAYAYLKKGIEDFAGEMEAITDVSRDALFYKLKGMGSADRPASAADLAQSLDTTAGFINAAIRRNDGGDIFSYFGCEL